jgi:hypothetical protein
MTHYLQGLKEQNTFLKQQIEFSPNNTEAVKQRNNKKLLDTYLKLVETMKELEKESAEFIKFYEEYLSKIGSFNKTCVEGKSEFTAECRIEGDKIVESINSNEPKIMKYGERFNKLNKDLGEFFKKFNK